MTAAHDPASKPISLAIVGGGISGLVLAIALQRKSIPFTLYEAASKFGEIGAGVSFGPNASRAMSLIDPAIRTGFENVATFNQWASKSKSWFDFRVGDARWKEKHSAEQIEALASDGWFCQLDCGVGQSSVHRAHFLDEMVKILEGDVARFGKRLVNLEHLDDGDVKLSFQDGTEATHSAVIGCDGIKSKTREIVLGKDDPAVQPVYSGKYAYRGLIPMDKAAELLGDELARNSQMYFGYHGHVLTFAIEKGKTMNVVAFASSNSWDNPQWVTSTDPQKMASDFSGWGSHVHSILSLMTKTDIWALFNHLPARTYFHRNICLLGDAAHASTPHQGAGAGMGIEDALVMQQLLDVAVQEGKGKEALEEAFKVFDEVRRERTQRLVKTSKEAGMLYDFEGVEQDEVPAVKANLDQRMEWIWGFDLEKHVEESRALLRERLR